MLTSLLLITPYYPPHLGGLENFTQKLATSLASSYRVIIFTSGPVLPSSHPNLTIISYPAFDLIPNFPVPKLWHPAFWSAWRQLTSHRFAVVVSQTRFFLCSLFPLFLQPPLWLHIEHGSAPVVVSSPLTSFLARIYDHTLGRLCISQAHKLACISPASQTFIQKTYGRSSSLLLNSLDPAQLASYPSTPSPIPKDPQVISVGYAGRLYRWKNLSAAIKAVTSISTYPLKFYIAGSGEDLTALQKIAPNQVIFLGSLTHPQTISFLKSLDIYIHSSLPGGGLSSSLMEALYFGAIVVATPNEGANLLINSSTGFLSPHPTPESLRATLLTALNHKSQWPSIRKAARAKILSNFSWQSTVHQFIRLISEP